MSGVVVNLAVAVGQTFYPAVCVVMDKTVCPVVRMVV